MNIDETTIGIWFMELSDAATGDGSRNIGDILIMVTAVGEGTRMEGRFRWYDENDPGNDAFSGKDRKRWFHGDGPTLSPQSSIDNVRTVLAGMKHLSGRPIHEMLRDPRETLQQFTERFLAQPWCHFKQVTTEEARAMGLDVGDSDATQEAQP